MLQHLDSRKEAALVLIGLLVVLTLVEMALSYREDRKYYETRDTLTNIYLTSLAVITNFCVKVFTFSYWITRISTTGFFQIQNIFWYWFVLVIVQDFCTGYSIIPVITAACFGLCMLLITHLSISISQPVLDLRFFEPLYRVFFYLPLAFMGFNALDILYAYLITQLYGNLVHTQYKIPLPKWYGWIFVTPAHHRVHHASNIPYLDKNMGMVLIIWDRLFGTFRDEDLPEPVKYGITKQPEDMGPVNVLFHEWKALLHDVKNAPDLKSKIGYFIHPPGWSHDGSTQTARVLQREYREMEEAHKKHETAA